MNVVLSNRTRLNVKCAAIRREKAKGIFDSRRVDDRKLRSSLGDIANEEKKRVSSIWNSHKDLFKTIRNKDENTDGEVKKEKEEIVVTDAEVLENDSFFD